MPDRETLPDERVALLSPKERECLRLVLENRSSKQIARQLGISQTSVDTHVRRARAKLGTQDRYEAARLVEAWERVAEHGAEAAGRGPEPPSETQPEKTEPAPIVATIARPSLLPPIETLSFPQRLLMMVLGAIVAAFVFGLILSALAAL